MSASAGNACFRNPSASPLGLVPSPWPCQVHTAAGDKGAFAVVAGPAASLGSAAGGLCYREQVQLTLWDFKERVFLVRATSSVIETFCLCPHCIKVRCRSRKKQGSSVLLWAKSPCLPGRWWVHTLSKQRNELYGLRDKSIVFKSWCKTINVLVCIIQRDLGIHITAVYALPWHWDTYETWDESRDSAAQMEMSLAVSEKSLHVWFLIISCIRYTFSKGVKCFLWKTGTGEAKE